MKTYEILFLIRPDMEREELNSQYKNIGDIIGKYSGKIENIQDMGKRPLAYQIKKHKEGVYYLMNVKMDPQKVKDFKDELKLIEPILRMAFVKLDEKVQAAQPTQPAVK